MKLSAEERQTLKNAAKVLEKIRHKFGGKAFCQNECGCYDDCELDDAQDLCELLSRYEDLEFTDDIDYDSCK